MAVGRFVMVGHLVDLYSNTIRFSIFGCCSS